LHARSFWLATNDGMRLYALEAARAKTTVVLRMGARFRSLRDSRVRYDLGCACYRVLTFDFRGNGRSSATHSLALGNDLAAAASPPIDGSRQEDMLLSVCDGGSGSRGEVVTDARDCVSTLERPLPRKSNVRTRYHAQPRS